MSERLIQVSPSAYPYPLLLKHIWTSPLLQATGQEVVYRDVKRFSYGEIRDRVGRLASALAAAGVQPGDTVGVMDWDSHRFLEAFFAIPMMGAVLQTVNVRLSNDQIAYTIDHAGATTLLVNDDFAALLKELKPSLPGVKRLIVMSDRPSPETAGLAFIGDYELLLAAASPDFAFPDFDENTQATTFYTTGTTGLPKGVYYSHRQLVLHSLAELAFLGIAGKQGRFSRDDVYMPITPMFHVHAWGFPWAATLAGVKQVYPGRYDPALLVKLIKSEGVTFTHGVPTILQMVLNAAAAAKTDLAGLKMVIGGAALTKALAKQALAAGIDIFAGYGMSETGPVIAIAQVRTSDLDGDPDQQVDVRTSAGIDRAAGRSAHRRSWHDGRPARRQNLRGDCPSRALADAGLLQQSAGIGRSVGGRLSAYRPTSRSCPRTDMCGSPTGSRTSSRRAASGYRRCRSRISSRTVPELPRPPSSASRTRNGASAHWRSSSGTKPRRELLDDHKIRARLKVFSDGGVISKYGIPEKILFIEAIPRTSVGKIDKKVLRERFGEA